MRIGRAFGLSLAIFTVLVTAGAAFVYFDTVAGYMLKYVYWRSCNDEGGVGAYAAVNGINVYYEIHGDGHPLVLLHGGATSIEIFFGQLPVLAKSFKVYAFDSRGHGRSSRGQAPLSYALMAADTIAALDALGVQRAHLVGWSDGGNIGLYLAVHYPERIDRLVVISANFRPEGLKAESMRPGESYAGRLTEYWFKLLSPAPDNWPRLKVDLQQLWDTKPTLSEADLGGITAPTLIIAGEQDIVTPAHIEKMHHAIKGSVLQVIPGTTHSLLWQRPRLVNKMIIDFLLPKSASRWRACR